jgi:DNA-binding NtrC family response regulator
MTAQTSRTDLAPTADAVGHLRSLLAEYERMSEEWRRQLQTTLAGFDELETQRKTVLAAAVQAVTTDPALGPGAHDGAHPTLPVLIAAYERNLVQWALANTRGNQKEAAILLGIRGSTLHEKMKRLGLLVSHEPHPPRMTVKRHFDALHVRR